MRFLLFLLESSYVIQVIYGIVRLLLGDYNTKKEFLWYTFIPFIPFCYIAYRKFMDLGKKY